MSQARSYEVGLANDVVNTCGKLAVLIDDAYHEACLDTSNTNRPPISEREAVVSLLEGVALVANWMTDPETWVGGPESWDGPPEREFRHQVPWAYLTSHGWGLPRRSGLPEGWQALPARRLVAFLTERDHQQFGAINPRDREAILCELERRDPS